jgi:phosphatidylglycerophosphate synthase
MTDGFALGLVFTAAGAGLIYGLRAVRRGRVQPARLRSVQGGLVARSLLEAAYFSIAPVTRGLAALGVTPDQITWTSLLVGAGAGVALATGRLGLAAVLETTSALLDILDGEVARATARSSNAGEVLDAAADRYAEFFLLAGAVVFYRDSLVGMLLALGALAASFMVSYASAKAEAMQVDVPAGVMRRHERAFFLIAGCAFSPLLPGTLATPFGALRALPLCAALALVTVAGNAAAIVRLKRIAEGLRSAK